MHVLHNATKPKPKGLAAAAAALALACTLAPLSGCAPSQPAPTEEAPATATGYMTSMAKASTQLSESLGDFASSVADGDVSVLQAKADSAYEVLGQMESLEAPEELKPVKGKYDEAVSTLKGALEDYLHLFLELENTPEGTQYDYTGYAKRLEAVQKAYDQGLNLLEEADKMATEM